MRFSSNNGGALSSLSHSRVGLAPPLAPAEDSPLVGFEEGVGQISQSRDTPLYATLGLSGKPNPHVNARAHVVGWHLYLFEVKRRTSLSHSGFVVRHRARCERGAVVVFLHNSWAAVGLRFRESCPSSRKWVGTLF